MRTHPRLRAHTFFLKLGLLALTGASLHSVCLLAQSASAASPAKSTGTAPDAAAGFSIETEMLTYRALESNGEAIACDVAAYLYGAKTDFKNLPTGSICNVGTASGPSTVGVIVLPFDRSVFSDFQVWRSDMQTMAEFETRGAAACNATPAPAPPPPASSAPPGVSGRGLTAGSAANTALGFMPGGNMVSAASGVLGLFANDHASSPVGGTIQDQAFIDNVSRELRAVNVAVLMPSVYTPYALTSIDAAKSPFLVALDKLFHTRDCMIKRDEADPSLKANDPDLKSIDDFLAVLSSGPTTPAKPTGPASSTTATTPSSTTTTTTAPAAQPASAASSHLDSVLSADGLAQRLKADPATGTIPANSPQHILLIKALESGGSVNKSTTIFGTKISYSGGSVGTYALFDLNGELECSGNVYDYAGAISSKRFQAHLRGFVPDPGSQVIFQRGACRTR